MPINSYPTVDHAYSKTARGHADPIGRWVFAVIGMTPITALALSLTEVVPLHIGGPTLVGTAICAGIGCQQLVPGIRRPVASGLMVGFLAVFLYDCTRLPFVIFGQWPDFIPKIGVWLFDKPGVHWSVGYLWRYLGNGAGMGLTFAMIVRYSDGRIDRRIAGVLFGVAIWTGLVITVLIAPDGQTKMFTLTPATVSLSHVGHLVFGGVLGLEHHRRRPIQSQPNAIASTNPAKVE